MDQNLNVRAKMKKLLNESIGLNLHDLGFGEGLFYMKPKAQIRGKNIDLTSNF